MRWKALSKKKRAFLQEPRASKPDPNLGLNFDDLGIDLDGLGSNKKVLEIYVWPYTFIYAWFVHFTGARERYDATTDHISGIVKAGTD